MCSFRFLSGWHILLSWQSPTHTPTLNFTTDLVNFTLPLFSLLYEQTCWYDTPLHAHIIIISTVTLATLFWWTIIGVWGRQMLTLQVVCKITSVTVLCVHRQTNTISNNYIQFQQVDWLLMHIHVPRHAFILILVQITAGLLVNLLNVLKVTSADNSTWEKWFLMSEKKKGQMRLQPWVKGKGYNTLLWEKLRKKLI